MKRNALLFLFLSVGLLFLGCSDGPAEKPTLMQPETKRKILLREVYLDCEHVVNLGDDVRSSQETEKEILEVYPEFTIDTFSPEQVTLVRYQKGKCDEHILFKEYRGKIGAFKENNGALLDVLDVPVHLLRQKDQKMLKDGVSVFGKEESAAFLDDFET